MPHWKKNGIWACVAGTLGCKPPQELKPEGQEAVFQKQFYSAFGCEGIGTFLEDLGIGQIIVTGLYLHGCVRATVLDAYERGLEVWVAEDATASTDSLHARVTREYLADRVVTFLPSSEILQRLQKSATSLGLSFGEIQPVGHIAGSWLQATRHALWEHRNPAKWDEVLDLIPLASREDVACAAAAADKAQYTWRHVAPEARAELLMSWASKLAEQEAALADIMAHEIGKPIAIGHDEVRFAIKLLHATASVAAEERGWKVCGNNQIHARGCPAGVVGIITPWNNPIAIPVGKVGPAIAFGNGVVWKAALQPLRTTKLVLETLVEAGLPSGLVSVIFGGAETAKNLIFQPQNGRISFTGSCAAGKEVAKLCARFAKPLQAEMGGNNGAIIMPDTDVERSAQELALAAFSFAGQRCTATRRFIVHEAIRMPFEDALRVSIKSLQIGDPRDPATQVGPVISRGKQTGLRHLVAESLARGARVVCGGNIPSEWESGCWFQPTVLDAPGSTLSVVQEETFGPIAVLQTAKDLDDALRLLNAVPQGLIASLYSQDRICQERFLEEAESGVLKLNEPTVGVQPDAPFGGWKASGLGPPEHGTWDLEFYLRVQALYGWREPN
jgi:acyl-CoA reductase-like NAD-dependent aldehyde dehydrogenase